MENLEGEASSYPEQRADPAVDATPIGVQARVTEIDRILAAMAQYTERQAKYMQWQTQHATAAIARTGLLERFKKLFPTEFEGTINPEDAENWLKAVERVLEAMGVSDEQKVTLATFTLKGKALEWWEACKRLLSAPLPNVQPPVAQVITWARFVKAFNDQYIPESYRFEQEATFINLKQEGMTVSEYDAKFIAFSKYATYLVDTEEKMCRRFRTGLETNVRTRLTSYTTNSYAQLVEMARRVDNDVQEMFDKREQRKKSKTTTGQASQAGRFSGGYKGGSRFQHLKGQSDIKQGSEQGREVSKQGVGRGDGSSSRGTSFQCFRCGSPDHRVRDCPEAGKGVRCYNCDEMGHISTQCTRPHAPAASSVGSGFGHGASSRGSISRGGGVGGSTAPGRVYAITRQNAQATSEVVIGSEATTSDVTPRRE